ncbi:MAG: DUF2868 domain-containing protein [Planctomycetota bacterium]|nr:DUF2868 domain-containing protein [Planctomycetota bacterium]
MPRLKPAGLLSLAMANLIQNGGSRSALVEHVPDPDPRPIMARLDEVASAQPESRSLARIMRSIRHWETGLLVFLTLMIISALGAITAAGSLDPEGGRPVNLFWILGGVLGGQTLLLLLWIVLALFGGRLLNRLTLGGLLAGSTRFVAQQLTPRKDRAPESRHRELDAASAAVTHVDFGGARARWALGALTHLSWTTFNIGLLIGLVVILSIRQFDFGWETTIGSPASFECAAEVLSWTPGRLGFDVPTPKEFTSARIDALQDTRPAAGDETRRAFSGLLIGSIVLYGLLPRMLLFLICAGLWRRARGRWRPDIDAPSFAPLRSLAEPRAVAVESMPPIDAEHADDEDADLIDPERSARGSTIVGIELEPPACGWPPPCDATVTDLGVLASREDRAAITRRLAIAEHAPSRLVVFADLSTTPDRGVARSIRRIHDVTNDARLRVVLTGGERFRNRSDARVLERRISDWVNMVEDLGVEGSVTELDLDHLTAESRARLNELIAGKGRPELPRDRGLLGAIDTAFAEIAAHARKWPDAPAAQDILALHKAVARCVEAEAGVEIPGLPDARSLIEDPVRSFQSAADRITSTLPDRLRSSAKWTAVGGTLGVLACLASAGTLAPAALAVLPTWLASGAISGGVLSLMKPRDAEDERAAHGDPEEVARIRGEAVTSAAMMAVMLALQGRGERFIQEAIDRTFQGEPPEFDSVEQIGPCLGAWRQEMAGIIEERALQ